MILSILVPESALDMARLVAEALRNAQQTTIFVDCNAISPGTMKAVAEVITAAGSRCLDAGIIGSPPTRPGVTRFYASGPGVEDFIELANCGLDIRSLGAEIGLASALKMCYAGPRSWRRQPQQLISQVEEPKSLRKWGFLDSLCHSEWPKVADAVIKAVIFL